MNIFFGFEGFVFFSFSLFFKVDSDSIFDNAMVVLGCFEVFLRSFFL